MTDDELEEHYCDLVMFAALSVIADKAWNAAGQTFVRTTSDQELAHLAEYVQRIEDTKLWLRIEQAVVYSRLAQREEVKTLNNDHCAIVKLPHFAEIRYGVHLKRTNEFGIYSSFYDEGQFLDSFYRTDPTFKMEEPLHPLTAILEEVRLAR